MHIDVDPAEINKNKEAHISMCADTRPALQMINRMLDQSPLPEVRACRGVEGGEEGSA